MTTLNNFKIVHQTKKALLLQKDSKEFWIQKNWVRKDESLTPAALKAFDTALTLEQKEEAKNLKNRAFFSKNAPDWESEKALGFDIKIELYDIDDEKKERVFIPKSQIKNKEIPAWLINAKIKELQIKYAAKNWGGFAIQADDVFCQA